MNILASRTLRICLFLCIVLPWCGAVLAADDAADLSPAIVQQTKKATVLVDVGGQGSGSGFLVHASGIFVTNAHVVNDAEPDSLKLVINSGQTDQKTVSARVVLIAEDEDLALLKTDEPVVGVPLPLASETGLVELAKAAVFGYPFGKMLAAENESYPSISINVGRISALRHDGAALERIQFDASTNPGNSGGPLIDKDGKVIGVIVSSIRGANVNFAIPVAKLIALLQKPVLSLRTPAITYARRAEVREFEVEVFPIVPVPPDAELAVHFGEAGAANRRSFPAVRRDGRLFVKAAPIDAARAAAPLRLRLEGKYSLLSFIANFDDCPVRIGDRAFRLSELSRIERNTDIATRTVTVTTTLTHFDKARQTYETLVGNVVGLPVVQSKINQAVVKFEDARLVTIGAYDAGTLSVPYEITLSSKGKAVASSRGALNFGDLPHGLESESEGRMRNVPHIIMGGEGLSVESLILPKEDVKQGTWVYSEEKGLETKAEPGAWCEIPVLPQNEYTVHVEMTPKQSTKGELLLQLPMGKAAGLLHIDGAKGSMKLDLVEAKSPDRDGNAPIAPFVAGKKFELRVTVRTDGKHGQILAWAEDTPRPLGWSGLIKNLAPPKGLPVGAEKLALGHQNLEMTIEAIRVGAEQGGLRLLRELPGGIRHNLSDLVGRWSFDAPLTDNKMPSIYEGNPATLVGAPQIGVGPAVLGAGAMRLSDEAGAGFVVAETASSTRRSHLNRTLSMWFRADAPVPANQRQYLYDEGGSDKGFALYLQGDTLVAGGWDPKAEWKGTWLKAPHILPGQWYHVALVVAGKSEEKDSEFRNVDKNQAFRLYLNGTQMGAGFGQWIGPHEMIAVGTVVKSTQASPDDAANRAITNHQFVGMIDEVEILNGFMDPGSIPILAGGRFGINAWNDQPVVPNPPVPKPALAAAAAPSPATPPGATPARTETAVLTKPAATPAPVPATSVKIDRTNPAVVQVTAMPAAPLAPAPDKASGMWEKVAEDLRGATSYFKSKQPVAEVTVTKAGRVYVACDYAYQGNTGGGWQSEVFTKEDYLKDGWSLVLADLKMWDRPDMVIFTKVLPAGTKLRLRCNKYQPPVVITF